MILDLMIREAARLIKPVMRLFGQEPDEYVGLWPLVVIAVAVYVYAVFFQRYDEQKGRKR